MIVSNAKKKLWLFVFEYILSLRPILKSVSLPHIQTGTTAEPLKIDQKSKLFHKLELKS